MTIDPTPEDIEAVARHIYDEEGEGSWRIATAAWHAVVARVEARMRPVLDHARYRGHEWAEWCYGCQSLKPYLASAKEGKSDGK